MIWSRRLMLARSGENDSEEKGKYIVDDSIGCELSNMSARKDRLEKKMINCSNKKKAVRKKRKLEILEIEVENVYPVAEREGEPQCKTS